MIPKTRRILVSTEQVLKKEQHFHAHSLLSRCLGEQGVSYTPGETPVVLGEHGKPSLAEYPELHYNISHSEGIAAAMISPYECGVDCERIRSFEPRVMKRVFSDREREAVENAPESRRELLFFSLWTLKEAYVKAIGRGLTFPMRQAEFSIEDGDIQTALTGCSFTLYIIGGEFALSVCELTEGCGRHRAYDLHPTNKLIVL